jgi:hypothetical protein
MGPKFVLRFRGIGRGRSEKQVAFGEEVKKKERLMKKMRKPEGEM